MHDFELCLSMQLNQDRDCIRRSQMSKAFVLLLALLGISDAFGFSVSTVMSGRVQRRAPSMNFLDNIAKKFEESMQEVTVQHVLLPTQFDAINLYEEILSEELQPITPKAFGRIAASRSSCGSAKKKPEAMLAQLRGRPGELKFRRGAMAKEFERTAFEAPVGELQRPFQTEFGWHIMLVNSRSGEQ